MKSLPFMLSIIGISLVCTMCSKDEQPPQTPAIRNNRGLLATIGINASGNPDSFCFRYASLTSISDLTYLSVGDRNGGFLEKPRDLYALTAVSSGRWTLTNNVGGLLRLGSAEFVAGNATGRHHLNITPIQSSDSARLILHDAGGSGFYIESAFKPGLHLITEPAATTPPSPRHERMRWDPAKKQKWFIVIW